MKKTRKAKKKRTSAKVVFLMLLLLLIITAVVLIKTPPLLYPTTYNDNVQAAAKDNDIDPMLVFALIKAESNFKADAVSASGAVGLMQLMPDTANWIADKMSIDYDKDKLTDVETNIQMGTWYLSYLLNQFDGDLALAIVAYNAGVGRVNEWIAQGIWDGTAENSQNIPYEESRNYLRRVLANYDKYKSLYD